MIKIPKTQGKLRLQKRQQARGRNRCLCGFALYFGHIANYQSRGVYNAPEQLSLYGDGVPGKYFSDSFRAQIGPGEVDVDLCVPSTMLPAMMLRWNA